MTEEEFRKFRQEIERLKNGSIMKSLATTQYYQALRISEAAALKWKHVIFNRDNPKASRITIEQHVVYAVEPGEHPSIDHGFKNSKSLGGVKDMPMFPETFEALSELFADGAGKGQDDYVFPNEDGDFFSYYTIKHRYDKAFKKAGFSYTATHVLRHGWTCEVFNATSGDYALAGQLLGNVSDKAIRTYAKREKNALTNLAQRMWKEAT